MLKSCVTSPYTIAKFAIASRTKFAYAAERALRTSSGRRWRTPMTAVTIPYRDNARATIADVRPSSRVKLTQPVGGRKKAAAERAAAREI
jgi:hypothetical protein